MNKVFNLLYLLPEIFSWQIISPTVNHFVETLSILQDRYTVIKVYCELIEEKPVWCFQVNHKLWFFLSNG